MNLVEVRIRDRTVGALLYEEGRPGGRSVFEYDPGFISSGLELSPVMMPLSKGPFTFRVPDHFNTLPGLLADSLPDRFGNSLIDSWLASQGIPKQDFTPADRLGYVGSRGMGALEFKPSSGPGKGRRDHAIDVERMSELAGLALKDREAFIADLKTGDQAIKDILSIGTSAGGARAKAVIAFNERNGLVRSGQVNAGPGFEHYILKFDGADETGALGQSQGYGRVEFAYYLLAREAGVRMNHSRLFEEGGRAHFMTRRFDREGNSKRHVQTLSALQHLDFSFPYSWEGAISLARQIQVPAKDLEQMYLRAMFNVAFRNQDDHVKNTSFTMDDQGTWALAPAYDLIYAHNPAGDFTYAHQMSVNGERIDPAYPDFVEMAATVSVNRGTPSRAREKIRIARGKWFEFAEAAGIDEERAERLDKAFRDI